MITQEDAGFIVTQDGTRKELGTGRTLPRSSYVDQDGHPVRFDPWGREPSRQFARARKVYEIDGERRVLRVVKSADDRVGAVALPWYIPEPPVAIVVMTSDEATS